ncbi:thioredoxin [Candidatus Roizmanbacteria bacterium RIFOXYB2_FULL_38_10]|uniref:Thioredoxin n=1 Tax=Candidatus Roizmanbacteria bacterium RIFOXYD1_FULL_38_12 TaxID=1802093 RepID=A0A1F7L232_9BACT|nr:MAG: thioredoxin [Candidatus Roizmanbacteria bacterium RIFOXYA2_FULL_38_14]OGK64185.1 MAG: thioredoxin [Candidatus Roizmanbacteria bacterium RIFOXYA1_FULL_37_12]OGK66031.1 MAG: thioredoxin [Candidatus Roizmanbacteria bacterium RIFOXYB1_FULL_40_23]OGK67787.1 MAG: thioredoxin [Candidatus Roizmanbacteria bacterium RIFOXYB2_FULL_38_10]OGK70435.1 MAG: thioredoxin [Candidatus Roizmanbacteria bacterium RIFOXYC1_FULL_38_14]OGK71876.1 MAG: thioredoxin [Candidatus Roizmanbacteria bacterium RIFOXYC2_F
MNVVTLTKDAFPREVLASKGYVFVDFYAEWCGPCKLTSPIIDSLADEYKDIKFYKVNVDENSELASQYSVFSIPTFVIFKGGEVVAQFSGALGKEGFVKEIKQVTGA